MRMACARELCIDYMQEHELVAYSAPVCNQTARMHEELQEAAAALAV